MASPAKSAARSISAGEDDTQTVATLLRALLAVQVADREDRIQGREPRRTELVLVEAGVSLSDAAGLTGKNYDAVRMAVTRAKERDSKAARSAGKNG